MQSYKLKYRKRFFWRSLTIVGHGYNDKMDRLTVDLPDGTTREFARWSLYDCKLGLDWIAVKKRLLEKQAGQSIPVDRPV